MSFQTMMIDGGSAGMRLDLFLARRFLENPHQDTLSRSAIQKLIEEGGVTLNGLKAKSSVRLKADDVVQVQSLPPRDISLEPEALPLEILYEDQDCLVLNKSAGVVVHPAAGRNHGTVVNALLHHCSDLEGIGGQRRPGIVHRLDKDTSGVMIVAKNAFAYHRLADQFKDRRVHKEYLALVRGKLEPMKGLINRPIGRHRTERKKMSSIRSLAKKREAVTEWKVERHYQLCDDDRATYWFSRVRLIPHTGRTHQIRVHLADLGYPLVGDRVYGQKAGKGMHLKGQPSFVDVFPRQVLHAEKLEICHSRTGQRMEFYAPWPDDIRELIKNLEEKSVGGEPMVNSSNR